MTIQRFLRKALIPTFGVAGILHFIKPEPFDSIVPEALPGEARTYTYTSGAAELAAAVLLAAPKLGPASHAGHQKRAPRLRKLGGGFAAALLLAVWPANFEMARQWRNKPWQKQVISIGRLPLQLPLISAAWSIFKDPSMR